MVVLHFGNIYHISFVGDDAIMMVLRFGNIYHLSFAEVFFSRFVSTQHLSFFANNLNVEERKIF